MAFANLPRARVIKAAAMLRAQGRKLPKHGYCVTVGHVPHAGRMSTRVELCRDARGLYAIPANAEGLFGARRRRKLRRRR